MAQDMGKAVPSSVPGLVLGILAGAIHAIRFGAPNLPVLWAIALLGGGLGAIAAYLSTLRQPGSVLFSGLLFGLLGGGPIGVLGGALVGGTGAIRSRPRESRA
jgi:hypothetical protein